MRKNLYFLPAYIIIIQAFTYKHEAKYFLALIDFTPNFATKNQPTMKNLKIPYLHLSTILSTFVELKPNSFLQ